MTDLVFFYGTLRSALRRNNAAHIDGSFTFVSCGWIGAILFDLGPYPGAIPSATSHVRGELHRMLNPGETLRRVDEFEVYHPDRENVSLFVRRETLVTLDNDSTASAWVYFFNGPLGRAPRIDSGDYLDYLKVK